MENDLSTSIFRSSTVAAWINLMNSFIILSLFDVIGILIFGKNAEKIFIMDKPIYVNN